MFIVIEGVDGSGKTTLAKQIAATVPGNVTRLHRGPIKRHPLWEYANSVGPMRPDTNHYVADRWHVGEMIYGPLYRGKSRVTNHIAQWIELFLESRGAVKLWMDTPLDVVKERLSARGEDFLEEQHIEQVLKFYEQYCTNTPQWIPVRDVGIGVVESIAAAGRRRGEEAGERIRKNPTYVGGASCDVLFVVPGGEGQLAGAPYSGTTGDVLMRSLHAIRYPKIRQIGFVAATDKNIDDIDCNTAVHVGPGKDIEYDGGDIGKFMRDLEKIL